MEEAAAGKAQLPTVHSLTDGTVRLKIGGPKTLVTGATQRREVINSAPPSVGLLACSYVCGNRAGTWVFCMVSVDQVVGILDLVSSTNK